MKFLTRFLISVVLCSMLISIASTQWVLHSVSQFGLDVSMGFRLQSTLKDLGGLGPTLLGVVAPAYAVGFLLSAGLSHIFGGRAYWRVLAGLSSVPTAFWVLNASFGLKVLALTTALPG